MTPQQGSGVVLRLMLLGLTIAELDNTDIG